MKRQASVIIARADRRRFSLWREWEAACLHLYGINQDDAAHIMDTFPVVRRKDEDKHGHYRAKDTILETYAALAEAQRTGQPYQTRLNPPPADPRCCHPPRAGADSQDSRGAGLTPGGGDKPPPSDPINPALCLPGRDFPESSFNQGSGRYYARLSQVESLSEDPEVGYPAVWVFEAFDAQWFDQNPLPASPEGLGDYYVRARLFVLEVTVHFPRHPLLQSLKPVVHAADADDEPTDWFAFQTTPVGGRALTEGEIPLTIYPNLYLAGIPAVLAEAAMVPPERAALLSRAVSTTHIGDATEPQVAGALTRIVGTGVDWAVVYDVGQGNAIGLCEPGGSVGAYFDFGGGVNANAGTFPAGLTHFCFTQQPPIILSHWDFDHWSSANRDRRALHMTWIAPRQSVGPTQIALMTAIRARGTLLLLPPGFPPQRYGQLYLELCTGRGRNHSGIALTLSEDDTGGGNLMLFPGDARYTFIPSFPNPPTAKYLSVAVPHHGGDMHNRIVPGCPLLPPSRLVYSYGAGNTFGHPRPITRNDHYAAGWRDPARGHAITHEVRETANRGASKPFGHVLLGWTPHATAPALACGPIPCQLQAHQL